MRRSLLVAFSFGVLVGGLGAWWLWSGHTPAPRAPRAVVPVSVPDRPQDPARRDAAPPAVGATEESPARVEPVREPDEVGFLLIDCRGSHVEPGGVAVAGLTVLGETRYADPVSAEDGVVRFRLWPDRYTAEWEDAHGPRRVSVTVRGGKTTTLRVTDPRAPGEDPLRPGFGRLEVRAFDLDHRPLREAYLLLFGRAVDRLEEIDLDTGESGVCSVDV
ncbi:MAG: hypothetical protein JSU66_04385, partial [Deltaproteobacteria bacterium]